MLKKHPKGMTVLFFTEMWERFGFYTLMAILILYMKNEFKWNDTITIIMIPSPLQVKSHSVNPKQILLHKTHISLRLI